jgi:predicted RNA-binding Zn-ribbon protein involved in translation (DUF1610 family)
MARKIHWDKVLASLNTTCTKCGRVIKPNEIMRVNFKEMVCPACGAIFDLLEESTPSTSSES